MPELVVEECGLPARVAQLFKERRSFETGLVVGARTSSAGKVYALEGIKTPDRAGQVPKNCSTFDAEWCEEHARQVGRMLPGGIYVLGLYVFSSDADYKDGVAKYADAARAAVDASWPEAYDRKVSDCLLVHACSSQTRYTCKGLQVGHKGATGLQPHEVKLLSDSVRNFLSLQCSHEVRLCLPVSASSSTQLHKQFCKALSAEGARIREAKGLILHSVEGSEVVALLDGSDSTKLDVLLTGRGGDAQQRQSVGKSSKKGKGGSKGKSASSREDLTPQIQTSTPYKVRLLTRPDNEIAWGAPREGEAAPATSGEIGGVIEAVGHVTGQAFVASRDGVDHALNLVKEDLLRSLYTRLELCVEDAHDDDDDAEDRKPSALMQSVSKSGPTVLPLPRRVFFPWRSSIWLCDYWQPAEGVQEAVERCEEALGDSFLSSGGKEPEFIFVEGEATASGMSLKRWDSKAPVSLQAVADRSKLEDVGWDCTRTEVEAPKGSNPLMGIVALLMVIVALLVGVFVAR